MGACAKMQQLSNVFLHLNLASYIKGERWWEDKNGNNWWNRSCQFDHDMIYFVKVGRFNLYMNGVCHTLSAGQAAYIPAGTKLTYDFDGKGDLEKYYVHFTLLLGQKPIVDCFELPLIIQVKDVAAFDRLYDALIKSSDPFGLQQRGTLLQLISLYLKESGATFRKPVQLQPAIHYINEHIGQNISVAKIAGLCGYSGDHFTRKFKEIFGITPTQYITDIKLGKAKELLLSTTISISDIASSLGFCEASHFTKFFCDKTGFPPSYYRKRC